MQILKTGTKHPLKHISGMEKDLHVS